MQDAHNDYDITDFHAALLDIISVMNQPLRDEQILQAAGVQSGTDAVSAACGGRAPWPGGGG